MRAVEHSASFARKVGIKQSVGRDFAEADKAKGIKALHRLPMRKKPKTAAESGA